MHLQRIGEDQYARVDSHEFHALPDGETPAANALTTLFVRPKPVWALNEAPWARAQRIELTNIARTSKSKWMQLDVQPSRYWDKGQRVFSNLAPPHLETGFLESATFTFHLGSMHVAFTIDPSTATSEKPIQIDLGSTVLPDPKPRTTAFACKSAVFSWSRASVQIVRGWRLLCRGAEDSFGIMVSARLRVEHKSGCLYIELKVKDALLSVY